ncbi:MAG TPA: hypothetical protein VL087_06905 [Nitrospirota bacterium]|nr:hypothetical protein [Nitrospirota bacterium]
MKSADGLSREYIFEAVERFYRRFYLRRCPILRMMQEMLYDRHLYVCRMRERAEFFSFMACRKEVVQS